MFPLLGLSTKAIQNTIGCMDLIDIVALSFCSKRTQKTVKAQDVQFTNCTILIRRGELNVFFRRGQLPVYSYAPVNVSDWGRHVIQYATTFNFQAIDVSYNAHGFNVEQICNAFDKIKIRRFQIEEGMLSHPTHQKYLKKYVCGAKALYLERTPIQNARQSSKITEHVIQNYDYLCIDTNPKLDDLLVMNSRSIQLYKSTFTIKDINRFIKSWLNGSNSRLEYISIIMARNVLNEKQFSTNALKGIDKQVVPPTKTEDFYVFGYEKAIREKMSIDGGFNIYRNDGTRATFKLFLCEEIVFYMFVSH